MTSLWKPSIKKSWSRITILSMRRHVYTHVRLVLEWKERAFKEKVNSRCFCWFAAAILVDQSGPPIWRLHAKLYKVAWNVSANKSQTVGHKDPRLGQIVHILVFYNISSSWLPPQDGFQFIFSLRDSENDLYSGSGCGGSVHSIVYFFARRGTRTPGKNKTIILNHTVNIMLR